MALIFLIPGSYSAAWPHAEERGVTACLQVSNSTGCAALRGGLEQKRGTRPWGTLGAQCLFFAEPIIRLVVKNSGLVNLVLVWKVALARWHFHPQQICCEYQWQNQLSLLLDVQGLYGEKMRCLLRQQGKNRSWSSARGGTSGTGASTETLPAAGFGGGKAMKGGDKST